MKKLCLLSVFFIVFGCKEEASNLSEVQKMESVALNRPVEESKIETASSETNDQTPPTPVEVQTKIIKTANLKFESEDINQSFVNIQKTGSKYKATIVNDTSGKEYNSSFRTITIRIPNQYFDSFISEISQGIKHFDTKEISQQDVTEEYIDIESRMKAKKKLEERYLQLLSKANKVSEMLEIEKQLAQIREEIEAKEGQLKYLQNKISLSTITIEMYTSNPSESGATVSYGGKIWNAIQSGFNGLSNFLLSIIGIWPFILIFVGVFYFVKKRIDKKKE